jgi:hypothetical protein
MGTEIAWPDAVWIVFLKEVVLVNFKIPFDVGGMISPTTLE